MKIKALIFDLDGTLVDTLADIASAINKMLAHYSFPLHTQEEIRQMIGNGARNLVIRALPDGKTEEFVTQALVYYQNCYDNGIIEKTTVYDGLFDVLSAFKKQGIKMAVLSNKDDRHVKEIVNALLPDIFEIYNGFLPQFPHKPAPDAVYDIMKQLSVDKSETAFVGDSVVDIKTAQNSGIHSVAVAWGFCEEKTLFDAMPDSLVKSPNELLKLIQ